MTQAEKDAIKAKYRKLKEDEESLIQDLEGPYANEMAHENLVDIQNELKDLVNHHPELVAEVEQEKSSAPVPRTN